jgi:predicted nucleic-acid-binding protein
MIAVDTNILIRFLVKDDAGQAETVRKFLLTLEQDGEQAFIPLLVLLETLWVLESAYGISREKILGAIENLRQVTVFCFEADPAVERFLNQAGKHRADLSDILITESARHSKCNALITFDKKASKLPGVRLLT